ncbi:MAG: TetR/AcrR family transcriptional regulator [Gemmatimonadales bacterium]|nr:MAG: TetR/AcrR family transcriptional regulator [Gemmatimonadales bacterium]
MVSPHSYVHIMSTESTRRRILDAVVALHQEVGPAATTISAIAERAGVQRLTVYRHFPDEGALIHGCSAHWSQAHPPPDPSGWAGIQDPGMRLHAALGELYLYFEEGREMLAQVLRDEGRVAALQEVMTPFWGYMTEIAGGLSAGWGFEGGPQRLLRAAVGHALRFQTWESLAREGLSTEEAASLMADFVAVVAARGSRESTRPR